MTGITQMVLTMGEPIAGNRGRLSIFNSMRFGETASTTLVTGDQSLMSSLTAAGLPALGNGAFTIEYWTKFTNIQFLDGIVHQNGQAILGSASVTGGLVLLHNADSLYLQNYLLVNNLITIPSQAIPSQAWQLNTWYHVAISKNSSNQVSAWINGYRTPSGILSNSTDYYIPPTIIGSWRNTYGLGTTNNFIGNLYNLRVVKGSSVYNVNDSTINIPVGPLDLYSTDTKLLMKSPTGGTLFDSSGVTTVTPRAGTVNQTLSTPFNDLPTLFGARYNISSPFTTKISGSLYLKGTNGYATYAGSSGMAFGTGDFTIEWFSYSTDKLPYSTPWWYGPTGIATSGISFEITGSNSTIVYYHSSGSTTLATVAKSSYDKEWTHWALVRRSGRIYFYQNGILLNAGGTAHTVNYTDTSSSVYFGKKGPTAPVTDAFQGYITNFRVCKGIGVYTDAFTVPTGNLLRTTFANPYGGTNTEAIRSDQVPYLLVP